MKKVTAKHFYPFDSATLIRAFKEPEIIELKLVDNGSKDISTEIKDTEDGFTVIIERKIPAEVPAALKAFLGEWNNVKQTEVWTRNADDGYTCEMKIDIEDVPANIEGTIKMTSSGILTTNNVEIRISSSMPLLGGQIEKVVASSSEKSIAQEFSFIKGHLG